MEREHVCRVICTECGKLSSRYAFQDQLVELNPDTASYAEDLLRQKNERQARHSALAAGSVANTAEQSAAADQARPVALVPH